MINGLNRELLRPCELTGALEALQRLIILLAAFAGLSAESMSRGQGWRFLEIGRHLERAVHTVTLLRSVFVAGVRPDEPRRGRRCWRSRTASRPIAAAIVRKCNPAPCSTCSCSTKAIHARWATNCCSWKSWSQRSAATWHRDAAPPIDSRWPR